MVPVEAVLHLLNAGDSTFEVAVPAQKDEGRISPVRAVDDWRVIDVR